MSEWSSGYVNEIEYTHGYYGELSPMRMNLALLSRQHAIRSGRPLRYLELGYGQGVTLAIHAAANGGEFWGTDFNPSHAANARELAEASGANLKVLDDPFEELARRTDLPEFDMIALHGIWSWISDDNRRAIVDIARKRLAVGGVMYVSYNCTPGWSPAMPLRHLLMLHAEHSSGDSQGLVPKMESALDFAQRVVDAGAQYFAVNPGVSERLKRLRQQNRHYLVHEYFNGHWLPTPFTDVAKFLDEGKMSFAASANLLDHIDAINLSQAQQALLAESQHPVLTESLRDYLINNQFRRDLWVKGPRQMPQRQQLEMMGAQRYVLTVPPAEVPLKVQGALGEAELQADVYGPILDAMHAGNATAKSAREIGAACPNLSMAQVLQAMMILTAGGHASPAQSDDAAEAARPTTDALNRYLVKRAAYSGEIGWLASPVMGGGVPVGRFAQMFIGSILKGRRTPEQWAEDAWGVLSSQGEYILRDGAALTSATENMAELVKQAQWFMDNRMSTMKALGIV
ncbi:MAG: class I SAM-dependent methyltransferase [Aquabacterium sp.]